MFTNLCGADSKPSWATGSAGLWAGQGCENRNRGVISGWVVFMSGINGNVFKVSGTWGTSSAEQGGLCWRTARKNKCRLRLDGWFIPPLPTLRDKQTSVRGPRCWCPELSPVVPENARSIFQPHWVTVGRCSARSSLILAALASSWNRKALKLFFQSPASGFLWVSVWGIFWFSE